MVKKIFALAVFLFLLSFAYAFVCGNDVCESTENRCTCSVDCGQCSGDAPGICKAYQCVNDSCEVYSKPNCCGNDQCEYGEDYGVCPADCRPSEVTVEIYEPDTTDYFVRGEEVLFKVRVTSHGRKAILAEVRLSTSFTGMLSLLNDGKHGDANAFDDFFANTLAVPSGAEPGLHTLSLDVNFFDVHKTVELDFNVAPRLDVYLALKPVYFLGDNIELNVETRRKEKPVSLPITVTLFDPDQKVLFSQRLESKTGVYSTAFHSSLLEKPGLWAVEVQGTDDFNNTAFFRRNISVLEPGQEEFLEIRVFEPVQKSFSRGSEVLVKATVLQNNLLLSEAAVKLITPLREEIALQESEGSPGTYSGKIALGFNFPSGQQTFEISASKAMEGVQFSGSDEFDLNVQPVALDFEIISPESRVFRAGEEVVLRLALFYPNQEKASHAVIETAFNTSQIRFLEVEPGIYEALIPTQAVPAGRHSLALQATDSFDNAGSAKFDFEISGFAFFAGLQKALPFALIILVVVFVIAALASRVYLKKSELARLKAEEKKLLSLEKSLQKDYFEKNILSKKEFNSTHREYQTKLNKVRARLKELRKK